MALIYGGESCRSWHLHPFLFVLAVLDNERLTAEEMDERRRQNVAYEYLCHLEEAKRYRGTNWRVAWELMWCAFKRLPFIYVCGFGTRVRLLVEVRRRSIFLGLEFQSPDVGTGSPALVL